MLQRIHDRHWVLKQFVGVLTTSWITQLKEHLSLNLLVMTESHLNIRNNPGTRKDPKITFSVIYVKEEERKLEFSCH